MFRFNSCAAPRRPPPRVHQGPSGHCCRARAGTVAGPGRVGRPASEPAGGCMGGRSGGWVSGRAGGSVGTLSCSLIPFPSHSCPGRSKPLNPPRHATRPKPTPNSLILDFSLPDSQIFFPCPGHSKPLYPSLPVLTARMPKLFFTLANPASCTHYSLVCDKGQCCRAYLH